MPRPTKCRRVCRFPATSEFIPVEGPGSERSVILSVDEYETIRLIDKEGLSQEECSRQMGIARTTVQKIYETARKKLAEMLVEGLPLKIRGGQYVVCEGEGAPCSSRTCFKKNIEQRYKMEKGENIMRIAVTYENGQIFQHFGHTKQFKVYDVEDGKVVSTEVIDTGDSGHGALAGVLDAAKADTLICGGIGGGAQQALASVGIKLYGGVTGEADKAVEALISGNLEYDPEAKCDHHGEGHHGEDCGHHGHEGGGCGHHGKGCGSR